MVASFLAPGGDYSSVASFCGVKTVPVPADFMQAVDAAAEEVRAKCGPVLIETGLTHTTSASAYALVLPFRAAMLTGVTGADGTVYPTADFRIDPHYLGGHGGQVVRRVDGGLIPACTVTYDSGWTQVAIPQRLISAGREVARHLYRTTLGNQRAANVEGPPGYLWPRHAEALIEGWTLAPMGFA